MQLFLHRITPLLKVVQTFLNEPTLYEAITELPSNLDFLTTIISIATHPAFTTIQGTGTLLLLSNLSCFNWAVDFTPPEHLDGFIQLLPRVRAVFHGGADLSKLFAGNVEFQHRIT